MRVVRLFGFLVVVSLTVFSIQVRSQCLVYEGTNNPIFNEARNEEPILLSSGNAEWDKYIQSAFNKITNIYGIKCALVYLDSLDNAFAVRTNGLDSIYFGIDRIKRFMQIDPQMVLRTLAHECSHIYQYQSWKSNRYFAIKSTVKYVELQADYLAGYILCTLKMMDDNFMPAFKKVVETLGDYGFTNPEHHGIPAERLQATEDGIYICNVSVAQAFENSFLHVKPSLNIKAFNEGNFLGDIKLNSGETYYVNYDDEVFFKTSNGYEQVGATKACDEEQACSRWILKIHGYKRIYKTSWDKVYDESGKEIGKFTFYKQYFPGVSPPATNGTESDYFKRLNPQSVLLDDQVGGIRDQGDEGSSLAISMATAIEYSVVKYARDPLFDFEISPRFIYNSLNDGKDAGLDIVKTLNFVMQQGSIEESIWPYASGEYAAAVPPAAKNATRYKIRGYQLFNAITNAELLNALIDKRMILAVLVINDEFLRTKDGIIQSGGAIRFKHPVLIVGFNAAKQYYIFRNTWGTQWGDKGYGYIPFAEMTKIVTTAYALIH